jgi:hypothetical protein
MKGMAQQNVESLDGSPSGKSQAVTASADPGLRAW